MINSTILFTIANRERFNLRTILTGLQAFILTDRGYCALEDVRNLTPLEWNGVTLVAIFNSQ